MPFIEPHVIARTARHRLALIARTARHGLALIVLIVLAGCSSLSMDDWFTSRTLPAAEPPTTAETKAAPEGDAPAPKPVPKMANTAVAESGRETTGATAMMAPSKSDAGSKDSGSKDVGNSTYRLHPGDDVRITILDHKDASVRAFIAEDGTIEMPLIGKVRAAGMTVMTLRTHVTEALNSRFIVNPRVNVEVMEYRPFFVLGQVKSPGSYEFQVNMDVQQAVAVAGGFTRRADEHRISVTRKVLGQVRTFHAARHTRVLPGDVIEIRRRWF